MKAQYEFLKILTLQKKNPGRVEKIGFILKDIKTDVTMGYTFDEAFDLIGKSGCTNAEIKLFTSDKDGYDGRSIRPKEKMGLPSFDDPFWHLSILRNSAPLKTEYTQGLRQRIDSALKNEMNWNFEVRRRKWKQENRELFDSLYGVEMKEKYSQLASWIKEAKKIVVFTGEGVSIESGFPSLQTPEITKKVAAELKNASPEQYLKSYLEIVVSLLDDVLPEQSSALATRAIDNFKPNRIHQFFAKLEKEGKEVSIITSTIDGLHKKADSSHVLPLYGEITTLQCSQCRHPASLTTVSEEGDIYCEEENCNGVYIPTIDWSGNPFPFFDTVKSLISDADLLILSGDDFKDSLINRMPQSEIRAKKVVINHKPGNFDHLFDLALYGSIGTILKEVEQKLFSNGHVCSVCGVNAAEGLYASKIAPTSAFYCQSCMNQGAEPYSVFVTKVAISRKRNPDYQLSPRHQYFLEATLKVSNKTREQFEQDVEKRLQ